MKINDVIHLREIALPEGVRTKQNLEAIVFAVKPPMKELPPEQAAAEADAAKPELEVIKEKKDKVEGKEGAAPAAGKDAAKEAKKPAEGAAPKGK